MQLSQKQITFADFFLAVSIFRIIFEHFEEKDDPDR